MIEIYAFRYLCFCLVSLFLLVFGYVMVAVINHEKTGNVFSDAEI